VSKLLWSHDYSVQIPAIDNEHKLLVEIINELSDALDIHERVQIRIVVMTLDKLSRCIRRHFESEERFLMFNNYPEFDTHQLEHTKLMAQLELFERGFQAEKRAFNVKMLIFLKDWLVRHIITHDCKFGFYFRDKELITTFG
jgi:hemerythrin